MKIQADKTELQLAIDTQGYQSKPTGGEIGAIRNRLSGFKAHAALTIEQIADKIKHGYTIQGAQLKDKQSDENTDERFIQQQLFAVDIDNDYKDEKTGKKYKLSQSIDTPEQILEICKKANIMPCIIAESYSSGKKDPNEATINKYHVWFASDKPITSNSEARQIISGLQQTFGAVDEACKDPARLLFGTTSNKNVYNYAAVNSAELLLSLSPAPAEEPAPVKPERTQSQSAHKEEEHAQRNFEKICNTEADPSRLLMMIDPNKLDYEEWLRVSAAYKHSEGSEQDTWSAWNNQYSNVNEKADLKAYKALTGKGITKGTLKYFAKKHSPAEYDTYIQELTPKRRKRKAASPAAPASQSQSQTQSGTASAGELIPLELPFKRPENYVDFAFKNSSNKIIIIPQLLAENVRKTCKYIFVKGSDPAEQVRRFWYDNGVYTPIADEFIKNVLRSKIQPFGISLCKKTYIEEAFYQLSIDNAFHADTELNADENIINFKNGLLHLDTMEITAHTPEFLSTIQIPCNYNPNLTLENAPVFDRFITHLANNDEDSKQTLLEYIGIAISNVTGTLFKKALFLKGAGNCGKSQYILLLSRLLSMRYFGSASMEQLESRFGKYAVYNKRVVSDPDIRYIKISELENFKKLTGGDPIQLESKGKNQFTHKYKGVLMFGCNKAPLFGGDHGEWVYNRMLFINCGASIPKAEQDPLILDKMYEEREAIVATAITALKKAIANGYTLTESIESKKVLATYKAENDIVQEFFIECCTIRQTHKITDNITQQLLFDAFLTWARKCNYRSLPSKRDFRRSLSEFVGVDIGDLERKSNGNRYYIYTLKPEYKQELGFTDSISSNNYNRDIY